MFIGGYGYAGVPKVFLCVDVLFVCVCVCVCVFFLYPHFCLTRIVAKPTTLLVNHMK